MALFRIITLLIHAIIQAFASMLAAVFTRVVPALLAIATIGIALAFFCASCGIGSVALWRRRRGSRDG